MTCETLLSKAISDEEMERDIADTQAEIQAVERTIRLAQQSIEERREFIGKLRRILDERARGRE